MSLPSPPAPEAPLTVLKGIGPALQKRLAARGLHTVEDLLYLLPLGYEDRRRITPLEKVAEAPERLTVRGVVVRRRARRTRRRGRMLELWLAEAAGAEPKLHAIWFRCNPGLAEALPRGAKVLLTGHVRQADGELPRMAHPDFVADPEGAGSAGIHPRYPEVQGVAAARLRSAVEQACRLCLDALLDGIPATVAASLGLPTQAAALEALHLQGGEPDGRELAQLQQGDHPAHRRLALDEHFSLQLAVSRRERRWGGRTAPPCARAPEHDAALRRCLPFQLTAAQERVLDEILGDMERPRPMHRLLQGDVGSGKTAVAFGAAWAAMASGRQAAIMAPTEILARQHHAVLAPWCRHLDKRAALLTSGTTGAAREALLEDAAGGRVDLLIGTHALLSERVSLGNLALAVVDEQHRFGVAQRARLRLKGSGDDLPHLLVMTATPIPRSLALTVYGDLDLSLHGRVSARERDATMAAFRRGELGLLVATTVIEVGIDVPRAGVMVVEHADRFGLAQLHQPRGRVGRGADRARCLLLTDTEPGSASDRRLEVLTSTPDGFEVAEADLGLRGPGEALGTRQWGAPRLRFASLVDQLELLRAARQVARDVVRRDPDLTLAEHRQARAAMERRWPDLLLVGAETG